MNKLIFIGALPPPLHGMSLINKSVYDLLSQKKHRIIHLNMAPNITIKKLWLVSKFFLTLWNLFKIFGF